MVREKINLKKIWEEAQLLAIKEYEEETGGNWEDIDKYEREDIVFSKYLSVALVENNLKW